VNFNSAEFLLFLPVVLVLAALLSGAPRARHLMLLVASYVFYMAWDWRYAGLIAGSTLIDYAVALKLGRTEDPRARKRLLIASLVVNLGVLGVFKYFNFFVDGAGSVFTLLGLDVALPKHDLLLPVGISFYTFQTLSYTIDVYWRRIAPERDLTRFALFVSFFPQLVAGPIVRAADFLPQIASETSRATPADRTHVREGLARIFRGLFKKIVFADLLASLFVDDVFADPAAYSSLDLLIALYGYAFQIYNDFSGYSDIAIGAALMLGYRFDENFNRPYLSRNVREFWTRWHISLSSWLKDYLYIPLGGNRGNTTRNLMITMGLGGLWHGAGANFVLWGVYHGLLLVASRTLDRHASPDAPWWILVRDRVLTFHLVLFGWLLFRVSDMEQLGAYLAGLVQFSGGSVVHPAALALLAAAALAHFTTPALVQSVQQRWSRLPEFLQGAGYAAAIVVLCGVSVDAAVFIYFQF
jgi:D-alanyl-lipoteichoic acid acyltransferase DltB (MBOAT superfamily)